jgi:hypothetical protein
MKIIITCLFILASIISMFMGIVGVVHPMLIYKPDTNNLLIVFWSILFISGSYLLLRLGLIVLKRWDE